MIGGIFRVGLPQWVLHWRRAAGSDHLQKIRFVRVCRRGRSAGGVCGVGAPEGPLSLLSLRRGAVPCEASDGDRSNDLRNFSIWTTLLGINVGVGARRSGGSQKPGLAGLVQYRPRPTSNATHSESHPAGWVDTREIPEGIEDTWAEGSSVGTAPGGRQVQGIPYGNVCT